MDMCCCVVEAGLPQGSGVNDDSCFFTCRRCRLNRNGNIAASPSLSVLLGICQFFLFGIECCFNACELLKGTFLQY